MPARGPRETCFTVRRRGQKRSMPLLTATPLLALGTGIGIIGLIIIIVVVILLLRVL
jgi:hypothetical protein